MCDALSEAGGGDVLSLQGRLYDNKALCSFGVFYPCGRTAPLTF